MTTTSTHDHYDLVILGSGSTAFAAALHAAELGKTAVMTEERTVGGTCLNRGCVPALSLPERQVTQILCSACEKKNNRALLKEKH